MRLFFVGVLAVLIGTGLAIIAAELVYDPEAGKKKAKPVEVASFEECAAAGYSVVETYPRVCRTSQGKSYAEEVSDATNTKQAAEDTQAAALHDLIRVAAPGEGSTVRSPLVVSGTARGDWFLNAEFPVELVDASGRTLATGTAQASGGEWVTHEFVSFRTTLTFTSPEANTKGVLLLKRGSLAGGVKTMKIPVQF